MAVAPALADAFVIEGSHRLERHDSRRRKQERRAPDPRRVPARGRPGRALERAADPRRRHDARPARRPRRGRRLDRARTRCASTRAVRRSRRPTSASASKIRASFLLAGPLVARFGRADDAAAGRRRDRPAPARSAYARVPRARRRDGPRRPPLRDRGDEAARRERLPRRGERDGDGEHAHGRGAREGRDGARQRGVRAARAGPLPLPRLARRADRRHRVERPAHHRRRAVSAAARGRSGPTTSRSAASSAWRAITGGDITIEGVRPQDLVSIVPGVREARRAASRSAKTPSTCRRSSS